MNTNDRIRLVGIEGHGYHGVLASEREEGQPFVVDLVLHLDTAAAARADALGHTVNYAEVAAAVVRVIEGEPANLIETLAARIADAVLEFGVDAAEVTVHKPQAPVGVPFADVQVSISRNAPTGASWAPAGPGLAHLGAGAAESDSLEVADDAVVDTDVGVESEATIEEGETDLAAGAAAGLSQVPIPAPVPAPEVLLDNEGIPNAGAGGTEDQLDVVPEELVDVVLALGGNIGNARETLRDAVVDLDRTEGIYVTEVSGLAKTAPVTHGDAVAQDDYLNAVVLARTTLSPRDLLAEVLRIEDAHGRVRVERWGDRTLDIDIITYGQVLSSDPQLTLPHPRAAQRAFVLLPWAQVDPSAVLPGPDGGRVAELAEVAEDRGGVRWLLLDWLTDQHQPTDVAPRVASEEPAALLPQEPMPEFLQGEVPEASESSDGGPAASSMGGAPAVSEWLERAIEEEPPFAQATPAVPVPTPTPVPTDGAPVPAPAGEAGATDWIDPEVTDVPKLEVKPQWFKINPDA